AESAQNQQANLTNPERIQRLRKDGVMHINLGVQSGPQGHARIETIQEQNGPEVLRMRIADNWAIDYAIIDGLWRWRVASAAQYGAADRPDNRINAPRDVWLLPSQSPLS